MMKLWNPKGASSASRDNPCLREGLLLEAPLFSALPIDVMVLSQWLISKYPQMKKEGPSNISGQLKSA